MKFHNKILLVFLIPVVEIFVSNTALALEQQKATWTIMVYMAGDNDLEPYITWDIETELARPGSNPDVEIIALADRRLHYTSLPGVWSGALLFHVTRGMKARKENAIEDWGLTNMGDPQTFIDFVQWAKDNYPADHYVLLMWDHGWGWRPGQSLWDETAQDSLDLDELESAMNMLGPIDVVGYDACLMQTIEVQSMWRKFARAIAGAEEYVDTEGIRYNKVVSALQADPGLTAEDLAETIGRSMLSIKERTGSTVALDTEWDELLQAIDEWSVSLLQGLPDYRSDYDQARRNTLRFDDPLFRDLYDAALELKAHVSDSNIQTKSQAVMDAVDATVLGDWHHRPRYRDAHGITIFWPQDPEDLDEPSSTEWNDFEYYRTMLSFSRLTHWDEFLAAYTDR